MLAAVFLFAGAALAQDGPRIAHTPPDPTFLPLPGLPVPLDVQVMGADLTGSKMRVLGTIDGYLFDIPVYDLRLDERDRYVNSVTLFAPISDLIYQFSVTLVSGRVIHSERYVVQRDCSHPLALTPLNIDPDIPSDKKAQQIADVLPGVDRDIRWYEESWAVLEQLKENLDRRKTKR